MLEKIRRTVGRYFEFTKGTVLFFWGDCVCANQIKNKSAEYTIRSGNLEKAHPKVAGRLMNQIPQN